MRLPNHLGDIVFALPLLRALEVGFAKAEIHWIVRKGFADLPFLFGRKLHTFEFNVGELKNKLGQTYFDLGISLPASLSSAVFMSRLNIRTRIGFAEPLASLFYHRHLIWKGRKALMHKSDLYFSLLNLLPISTEKTPEQFFRTFVTSSHHSKKQIVIAPQASIGLREWPYFDSLLEKLLYFYPDHQLIIIGNRIDSRWDKKNARVTNLIGTTSLPRLLEILGESKIAIGNDSAIVHLAALTSTPSVVIFGPGDPAYIAPLGLSEWVRRCDLKCSPCEKPYCRNWAAPKACLNSISVDQVFEKVAVLLS